MRRRLTVPLAVPLTVLAALAVLLSGCQPAMPPSPSPTTPAPTPAPTPTPTPTENAQEREERIAYAQAEAALRAFRAEFGRLLNRGGAQQPPKSLTDLAGGPMLASAAKTLRQAYEIEARSIGTAKLVSVIPAGYSRDAVTIQTCEDGSAVRIMQGKKELGRGDIAKATYEVKRSSRSWRVWSTAQDQVNTCAGS